MVADVLVVRSTRILAEGTLSPGEVWVRAGKIAHVFLVEDRAGVPKLPVDAEIIEAGDLVVMPGLVDTHVHVNEPGRTDWEGFETAGRAAAAGGITTIVVMPLNCTPAVTNVAALMGEAEAAAGKCLVDYGFWGGLVPGNEDQLEPMWKAGALGFKAFMVDSGVEDFPAVAEDEMRAAAPVLAKIGAALLVHAEDPFWIKDAAGSRRHPKDPRIYRNYMESRPALAEDRAVRIICSLPYDFPTLRLHVVHVACFEAAMLVHFARTSNYRVSCETCPHYLTFASEEIADGATIYKCAPPIRTLKSRDDLWKMVDRGHIDMVVSDHSPCPPEMKLLAEGDFSRAWGGISSLQVGLPVTWTGATARDFGLHDIARWMAESPARLAGIQGRKGSIEVGCDADLILFDPDEEWTVDAQQLQHRHKLTPYDGRTLRGVVKRTILRGRTIYDAALPNPFPSEPIGQWIKRDN